MKRMMVAMDDIVVNANRQYGGEGDILTLAEDMAVNGLINAINLKQFPFNGKFEIVAGRRRHAAAKLLGWKEIKSDVMEAGEEEKADAISASENINRLDMHPLDEAAAFRRLMDGGATLESLAKRYARSKSAIWQRVQLLDLCGGIKELFREGKLSLHAAAMLNGLDAEKQEAFCKEAKASDWFKSGNGIPDFLVTNFVAKANNDKLYKCVAGNECQSCKKRTFYSDKELFPELDGGTGDVCLDHECYTQKWRDLLSSRIKGVTGQHKDHAGAVPLVTSSGELKKILGKSVFLGDITGAEVPVKFFRPYYPGDPEVAEKAGQGAKPCLEIELGDGGKLKVSPRYWKEPEKKQAQAGKQGGAADKALAPVVKLLGLPKDEAERAIAALKKKKITSTYQLDRDVTEKVQARVLKIKAGQPDNDKDIDHFLKEWLEDDKDNKAIAKQFAGAADVKALRKLSWPKLFAALGASAVFNYSCLPGITGIAMAKRDDVAEWAGIPMEQFKEIYREELRALLPKPEAAKPAKGKQAEAAEDGEDEWEHEKPLGRPVKKRAGVQTCRVCGCTHVTPCVHKISGDTCWWVEDDLCSACVGAENPANKPKRAAKKPAAGKAKKAAKKPAAKKKPARSAKAAGSDPLKKKILAKKMTPALKRALSRLEV